MSSVKINPRVVGLEPSATLALSELSAELARQGKEVYRFGFGQSPFPVPASVVQALKNHAAEKDYLPVLGLPLLRRTVAEFLQGFGHQSVDEQGIMVGPGSKELMFLLQLCWDGRVLLPSPSWVSYVPQSQILGRQYRLLATTAENRYKVKAEDLEAHLQAEPEDHEALLILNYPANPDGCSYSAEELAALAEVARRYNLTLLSDEIYSLLSYDNKPVSIAHFYPEGTIVSTGLSKWCGAGGWRLGCFAFPERLSALRDAVAVSASETFSSVSAPIQYAAIEAFKYGPDIQEYVIHSQRLLKVLAQDIVERLQGAGVRVCMPDGAYYLFVDFAEFRDILQGRGIHSSLQLCQRLLEESGVALLAGSHFYRPTEELTARLAFVDFAGEEALKASFSRGLSADLDQAFIEAHFARVLKGIERLVAWLSP